MSLAGMRARVVRLLADECVIQRHSTVSDGGGGTAETWADHATVPCRIEPAGGGETGTDGDRVNDETTHVVYLPALTDVDSADRLQVAGVTYEITAVRRWGSVEVYRSVEVREA